MNISYIIILEFNPLISNEYSITKQLYINNGKRKIETI